MNPFTKFTIIFLPLLPLLFSYQAIRVLQAMLDIVADEGWLTAAVQIVLLLQMIVQARWINENSLLTLPGTR